MNAGNLDSKAPATAVPATPAGTLLLLREDGRVLMMLRNPSQSFLGGFWVFPGGSVDATEMARFTDPVSAAAAAACRELQEETGLKVGTESVSHWAHWITPSDRPRRFDTHFFVAAAPVGQEARVDQAEASELQWVPPSRWQSADADGFALPPPTQLVLRDIAEALDGCESVAQLLIRAPRRRLLTVLPKMLDRSTVVMPWDPDYLTMAGLGIPWSAADVAARGHWQSRFRIG
jgi:8-oxo-dGTP pyrophosphatase MutT (NUDIX family)